MALDAARSLAYETHVILWLARSAMVTFYPRTELFPGIEDMHLDDYLQKFKRECAPIMWLGFVFGTLFYHATPLMTVYVPLPGFLLPEKLRELHAQRLVAHPFYYVRQPVFLLKMVAGLLWGSAPEVRERLGLTPYAADPGTWRKS